LNPHNNISLIIIGLNTLANNVPLKISYAIQQVNRYYEPLPVLIKGNDFPVKGNIFSIEPLTTRLTRKMTLILKRNKTFRDFSVFRGKNNPLCCSRVSRLNRLF
jgi:hypothetical protein